MKHYVTYYSPGDVDMRTVPVAIVDTEAEAADWVDRLRKNGADAHSTPVEGDELERAKRLLSRRRAFNRRMNRCSS